MKKCNYHTHTYRCMHACGSDEDYVISAIKGGYQVLGFRIMRHGTMKVILWHTCVCRWCSFMNMRVVSAN